MKRIFALLLVVAMHMSVVYADDAFVVSDIRVEGLQRISAASVFASLPVNVGDSVSDITIRNAIRSLFRSGNFDDITIARDGNILVVAVLERPSISEINIDGNKAIETEALLEGLSKAGLAEGKVFKRSTLEGMQMELTRQYVSQGRYDAHIDTEVVSLPRNRVGIEITIDEGTPAAIKHINIVGNAAYDDDELLDLFELRTTGWFSWLTSDDKYVKEKLSGDLETLKSHYLDNGYIRFSIESTQVSVTPDREAVYITVNIAEGEVYEVGEVDLSGDIILTEEELRPYVFIKDGEVFSQAKVTNSEEWITKRLGNEGYNFARVEGIPNIDEENKRVDIKFFVDPGKRTYVRRINFEGNFRTSDEVLRREMRQMESAPASSGSIELSKVRLERLGYFKEASVETVEVPGTDDLIDLVYSVEEQPSGSIGASVGFSQDSGVLFGGSIQQDNFMGTGNSVGISLNKSDYLTNARFSYVDPYYTKDGVSRGFSLFYRKADLAEINVSRYTTNTLGGNISFSYPISEIAKLGFSLGYSNTEIEAGVGAVQEILASPRPRQDLNVLGYLPLRPVGGLYPVPFTPEIPTTPVDPSFFYSIGDAGINVDEPGFLDENGNEFDYFPITFSWTRSTLNRGRLATRGSRQSVSLEVTVPGSDIEYFKLIYNGEVFLPLSESWIVRLRTELGYGDGFSGEKLPFFENFYSGGFSSVRGYKSNTLGPRSTPAYLYDIRSAVLDVYDTNDLECQATGATAVGEVCSNGAVVGQQQLTDGNPYYLYDPTTNRYAVYPYEYEGDPFGGNVLIEGSAELLFPFPFIKDRRSVRSAFFIDAGNVFSTDCGAYQANCFDVELGELRYSFGVGVTWITGFGPLTFSYAKPINESEFDETEAFQFSLGRSF